MSQEEREPPTPDGKLGQISTNFEVKCRKSARNMGIDHSEPAKTAPEADYSVQNV